MPNTSFFARTALVTSLALGSATMASMPAFAEEDDDIAKITVSATGQASVAPDMALMSLSVLREAKTARAALDANNEAMAEILLAMKEEGIEDKDLQTSGFSIQPQFHYPKSRDNNNPQPPRIVGYQVSNNLTVRVRNLQKLGRVLDQSVTLGVNQGGNNRIYPISGS